MVSLLACWQESTGTPRPFRYSVNPSSKVTCFEPKALPENLEKLDLRASMFGAVFLKKFNVLPKSGMSSIVWEAACFFSWVLSLNKKGSLIHVTDTPHRLTALSSCSSCEGCSQLQVTLDHNVLRAIKPKFWLTCQLKIPAQAAVKLVWNDWLSYFQS